jgi:hypothetical protein
MALIACDQAGGKIMTKILTTLIMSAMGITAILWNTQAPEELIVEDPRPLVTAIRTLEAKYGWQINYEDPPYNDPKDLVDRTHPNYRGPHRAIYPRDGRIEIHYFVSPTTGKPESSAKLLEMLVDDHARRGNPGRFQVKVFDGLDSVIPMQGSILDTPITLEEKERTYGETLHAILQELSRVANTRVSGPAMTPVTFQRFSFSAKNEPARDVLIRLFKTRDDRQYCWHLLYGPGWGYALNLHSQPKQGASPKTSPPKRQVLKEVTLPDGSKTKKLVDVP